MTGVFWSENVGRAQSDLSSLVNGWLETNLYRRNIFSNEATEIGIGNSGDKWVVVFSRKCEAT